MIRGAFATTSCGNMTDSIAPVRTPSIERSAGASSRLRPSRPPTPMQREAEAELDAACRTPR